jgi:hypothetical protein
MVNSLTTYDYAVGITDIASAGTAAPGADCSTECAVGTLTPAGRILSA